MTTPLPHLPKVGILPGYRVPSSTIRCHRRLTAKQHQDSCHVKYKDSTKITSDHVVEHTAHHDLSTSHELRRMQPVTMIAPISCAAKLPLIIPTSRLHKMSQAPSSRSFTMQTVTRRRPLTYESQSRGESYFSNSTGKSHLIAIGGHKIATHHIFKTRIHRQFCSITFQHGNMCRAVHPGPFYKR